MIVQHKVTPDNEIDGPYLNPSKAFALLRPSLDSMLKLAYHKRTNEPFHSQWIPDLINRQVKKLKPDVIHLHWICRGFLNIKSLLHFHVPIVWTLHDMWPFTGGCHYSGNCNQYKVKCGRCPILGSLKENDISRWTWKRKSKIIPKLNLQVISPSNWMYSKAASSSLYGKIPKIIIPNGIDTERFRPVKHRDLRSLFGLPSNSRLLLFGAIDSIDDQRKGFHHLIECLHSLSLKVNREKVELVILGSPPSHSNKIFGFKINYIGKLNDEVSLSIIYSLCDVFIAPSIEDNLPNTIMEAAACGTPTVAFNVGGIPEMIKHKHSGYLAKPFSIENLSKGIAWVISMEKRLARLSENARCLAVKTFDIKNIVKQHLRFYNDIGR